MFLFLGWVGGYLFEGLWIFDLGIIVVGGEFSWLFGDLGVEVIKVESVDYFDGLW